MISRDGVKVVVSVFLFDYCSYHMLLTGNILIRHKYISSYAQALSLAINVCTHTHTHTVQAAKLTKNVSHTFTYDLVFLCGFIPSTQIYRSFSWKNYCEK